MGQLISEKEFFHEYPQQVLSNSFCEKNWVTLFRKNLCHPSGNSDVDIDLWMWTYLVEDKYIAEALCSCDEDLRYERKGRVIYG